MPKTLRIKLTGEAEAFLEKVSNDGLSVKDALGKALKVFQLAWEAGYLALLDENAEIKTVLSVRGSEESANAVLNKISSKPLVVRERREKPEEVVKAWEYKSMSQERRRLKELSDRIEEMKKQAQEIEQNLKDKF